jgi:Ion channel
VLWWGVVTLTTVGHGDVTPVTTEGRIAAMTLMLLGIGLFGAITATITSYLMSHDSHHGPDHSLAGELERLATLHESRALSNDEFTAAKGSVLRAAHGSHMAIDETLSGRRPQLKPQHPQYNPLNNPQTAPLDLRSTVRASPSSLVVSGPFLRGAARPRASGGLTGDRRFLLT